MINSIELLPYFICNISPVFFILSGSTILLMIVVGIIVKLMEGENAMLLIGVIFIGLASIIGLAFLGLIFIGVSLLRGETNPLLAIPFICLFAYLIYMSKSIRGD